MGMFTGVIFMPSSKPTSLYLNPIQLFHTSPLYVRGSHQPQNLHATHTKGDHYLAQADRQPTAITVSANDASKNLSLASLDLAQETAIDTIKQVVSQSNLDQIIEELEILKKEMLACCKSTPVDRKRFDQLYYIAKLICAHNSKLARASSDYARFQTLPPQLQAMSQASMVLSTDIQEIHPLITFITTHRIPLPSTFKFFMETMEDSKDRFFATAMSSDHIVVLGDFFKYFRTLEEQTKEEFEYFLKDLILCHYIFADHVSDFPFKQLTENWETISKKAMEFDFQELLAEVARLYDPTLLLEEKK